MARRPGSVLAGMLAVAALALPAALLAGQQPAAAATGQRAGQSLVSIAITGMTRWATPRTMITVKGTLRNTSGEQDSHLTVQLLGSTTPVASVAELSQDASQSAIPAMTTLPRATWHSSGQLAAGATADWLIRIPAGKLGMTAFGVYPLAAQAQSLFGTPLATATTYLPYEPARKGAYASSRPSPAKISWLWPLIDQPLLDQPWEDSCRGAQASALAQSLGNDGRLGELVRAGAVDDSITWVADPALLANVRALATCGRTHAQWANAASAWLTELRAGTAGRPLTVTPYGDPNVAALIAAGHGTDVGQSFQLGRVLAGQILHRSMSPAATSGTPAALTEAASIAWPAGGVPGYDTLENLANVDGVRTLVLSSSAFPTQQDSVLQTLQGGGSYMSVLLASQSLTQLLGSASAAGSGFATEQEFLADTALLAQQVPSQPIVVAPPQRWDPPAGLTANLLADTAHAPWLSPVRLTSLANARSQRVPTEDWPAGGAGQAPVTRSELRKLRTLGSEIFQLEAIRARPDPDLYLALSAVESSAWRGASKATANAMLGTLSRWFAAEQGRVKIIAEKRITLGGLKSSVPVSVDNHLDYAVKVQLRLQYSQASGVRITVDPSGPFTVPADTARTIKLRVQAVNVGSTTVTMQLVALDGQLISGSQRMTVQATQVGVLGMIIFAAALGVFLIASAGRAVRRGRPGTGPDQPSDDERANDHPGAGSAERPEADTVKAERTELGAAGKPGP
jgi:hypothetical protein